MKANPRDDSFDVMKGILIVLVVVGHTSGYWGGVNTIIFWFHVPCFFMVSGALMNWNYAVKKTIIRRFKSYVIPYFSWCLLLYIVFHNESIIKFIIRILYGGTLNSLGYTYPFWYMNALFIGTLVFSVITKLSIRFRWNRILIGFVFVCFMYIRYFTHIIERIELPWSLEIIPFVLIYLYEGYAVMKLINKDEDIFKILSIICVLFIVCLIVSQIIGIINYQVNVKGNDYHCLFLDLFVPLCFFFFLKLVSCICLKCEILKKVFLIVGKSTLPILFSHASILMILQDKEVHYILQIVAAVFVGVALYYSISKSSIFSQLLLGKCENVSKFNACN